MDDKIREAKISANEVHRMLYDPRGTSLDEVRVEFDKLMDCLVLVMMARHISLADPIPDPGAGTNRERAEVAASMNIYTCTNFPGHYQVGVAAVIVAPSEPVARDLLLARVLHSGLACELSDIGEMIEFDLGTAQAVILHNGDY